MTLIRERISWFVILVALSTVPLTLAWAQKPSPTPGPDQVTLRQALDALPEGGVVVAAPGQEPIVIRPGEQDVVALGGQLRFRHYFEGGVPGPAESASATVTSAGPAFIPRESGLVLRWIFSLKPRDSQQFLEGVVRVSVEDVTGQGVIPVIESAPQFKNGQLFATSGETPFSREAFPWMFTNDRTLFVFRIRLDGDGSETLLQPVLVGPEVKQQVMTFIESKKTSD